jgi:polyisoprenoid-binding protein YceI
MNPTRFERYDGSLDLAAQPSIELTIEADSLNTNQVKRDEHLRSADFFDTANHPQVRFVSRRATVDGHRLDLQGDCRPPAGACRSNSRA